MSFRSDLERSRESVERAARALVADERIREAVMRRSLYTSIYEGNVKYADGEIGLIPLQFEVKQDFKAVKYGNIAIEISCNNKPSGIIASTAHLWIYVIPGGAFEGVWLTSLAQLRAAAANIEEIKTAGDGDRTRIKCMPLEDFVLIARRLSEDET